MEIYSELHHIPSKRRGLLIWGIVLTAVLLGFANMYFQSKSKLNKRLANVRNSNYPVTLAELDKWYETVPENENAALLVIDAYNRMVRPLSFDSELAKTNLINQQFSLGSEQTCI